MRLKLVYNPTAGRGKTRRHIEEVERYLVAGGADVEIHETTSAEDLTRAAAEASRGGYDRVVICGGDGSVHFAVRDFDLDRGVLATIPTGSGDDFARVLGISRKLEAACEIVLHGTTREVDVALANGTRYLGVAGFGFDSEVAAQAQKVRYLRGSAVYLYSIFRVLPRFTPHPVRMRIDGNTRDDQIMFATVGNTRQYGSGIRVVPDALPDDGVLDYCIVHRTTRLQLLITLPLAYIGKHTIRSFVETGRANDFHFESGQPLDVYADGEYVTRTPVTFGLEKQKLRVVVPR